MIIHYCLEDFEILFIGYLHGMRGFFYITRTWEKVETLSRIVKKMFRIKNKLRFTGTAQFVTIVTKYNLLSVDMIKCCDNFG